VSRLNSMGTSPGPARLKLTLDLEKNSEHGDRANARAVLDLDAPQFKGVATITAKPDIAALRGIDLDTLRRSEFGIESKLSSERGGSLLVLLGLDRTIAVGEGPAQFQGSVTGVWRAPLQLKARMSGSGLDAEAQGTAEPCGSGLLKGWRGRIAFQALRGALPGGGELRPVSGSIKSDGQSLTFDAIKGGIGGGEATANIDAKQSANGIALNARVQLSGVDGAALRYRALAMPAGRASMQMTLATQGRSASALTGALSGSGTVMLESVSVAGLNPRAFDAAIRASDNGQATDDIR